MPDLSVVIPAYNEERRLPSTLAAVHEYLVSRQSTFEIVIVDDGSLDRTVEVVEEFARHHDGVRLVSYSPNQGKGYAVRTGISAALGALILIDDADGSSPIGEVVRLEEAIARGADLAIGSRNKPDPERVIKALAHRKYMGNTFNLIVQALLLPGIQDTQCGFKLFKRAVAHDIFSVAKQNGFAFDVEILYIAKIRGYRLDEVAIDWANVEGSKVNVLTDSVKMLAEVLKIRAVGWLGGYKKKAPMELPKIHLVERHSSTGEPKQDL